MTRNHLTPHPSHLDKWQRVFHIVSQHPALTQPNLTQSFKKLWLIRLLTETALVFLLQYIGLMFSTLTPNPVPLWAASGTACAFIFLRGYRILPGIWLGSFVAYYSAASDLGIATSCATLFTLQAALLLFISYRLISPTLVFYSAKKWMQFVLSSSVLTAAISLALVWICYPALPNTLPLSWLGLNWWLANLNGLLIFACALTTLDAYFPQISALKHANLFKLGSLYGGLFALVMAMLFSETLASTMLLMFLTLPILIMISRSLGWCGAVCAIFLFGLLLSLGAYLNAPVFSEPQALVTLPVIQLFLNTTIVFSLFVAKR